MMGTRCGNIDPSVVFYLHNTMGMEISEIDEMLHRESGLLGISETSHDMRHIGTSLSIYLFLLSTHFLFKTHNNNNNISELAAERGNKRAELALNMFCARVSEGIAQMLPSLGKSLDALVFTGGIGEHSESVRSRVLGGLSFLEKVGFHHVVIPANESIQMATEARTLLRRVRTEG